MCILLLLASLGGAAPIVWANELLELRTLSAFQSAGENWRIAGSVLVQDPQRKHDLRATKGWGVLVNLPDEIQRSNLLTRESFGDHDLDLQFLMAPGSNSGIYLQGRYEIQLYDSWGVDTPRYGDCAGVYQRRRPDGSQYEGAAPRVNACKAPGLWQDLSISFRAPRFDAAGNKIADARLLRVSVNGVTVHEDLVLSGPTGGAISDQEVAEGPLMIQGDHGPLAFRNIRLRSFSQRVPALNLEYDVWYRGGDQGLASFSDVENRPPASSGTRRLLGVDPVHGTDGFLIRYEGALSIPALDTYRFELHQTGSGFLEIDGQRIIDEGYLWPWEEARVVTLELSSGNHHLRVGYLRNESESWLSEWTPGQTLFISAPSVRRMALHPQGASGQKPSGAIRINAAREPQVVRSFIDHVNDAGQSERIMKAVNVGAPGGLHYTVDLESGALVQIWRGAFLDATPMWEERGNASSRVEGAVLWLGGNQLFALEKNDNKLISKGYSLNEQGLPRFHYRLGEVAISDEPRPDGGRFIERQIAAIGTDEALSLTLARSDQIQDLGDGWYLIGDHEYYLQIPSSTQVRLETRRGMSMLNASLTELRPLIYRVVF